MGTSFLKNGAHVTKCGFDDFCQLPGIWPQVIVKVMGTHNILWKAARPRSECIPVYITYPGITNASTGR